MFGGLILYGVTSSALIPLLTLILMETPEVGPENMGTAGGLFFCIAEIGGFSCPLVVGTLVDWTGSFLTGGYFVAGLGVTILVLSLFIQDRSETS
jgi:cyanate permease